MLQSVHAELTRRALEQTFSRRALDVIIAAKVGLDAPSNQLGHDEFHFDNNAFEKSLAYLEEQRALVRPPLKRDQVASAWQAFGRLTHTAQDFYAHSNYVDLWLACQRNGMVPAPTDIDPLDDALLENPSLRSGMSYFPFGFLSFVPGLKATVMRLLPRDSHAWMNLDSAASGPMFEYAFHAALKRTKCEFDWIERTLPKESTPIFANLSGDLDSRS